MQEFENFREKEGTRNAYDIEKGYIYVSSYNRKKNFVSFKTYSAFL